MTPSFSTLSKLVLCGSQKFYIATSRELKRLDSLAMSPIFGHFSESLAGLLTLRAFRQQAHFTQMNHSKLDHSNRVYWIIQNVGIPSHSTFPQLFFLLVVHQIACQSVIWNVAEVVSRRISQVWRMCQRNVRSLW